LPSKKEWAEFASLAELKVCLRSLLSHFLRLELRANIAIGIPREAEDQSRVLEGIREWSYYDVMPYTEVTNHRVCVAPLNYTSEVQNSDGTVKTTRPFDAELIAKLALSLKIYATTGRTQ
jgi:hypothetical protein